jgi:hypothetical protein
MAGSHSFKLHNIDKKVPFKVQKMRITAKLHNKSLCFHLLYKDNWKKMGRRMGLSLHVCLGNRGGVIKDVFSE